MIVRMDVYVIEAEYRSCAHFSDEPWYSSTIYSAVLWRFDEEYDPLVRHQGDGRDRLIIHLPARYVAIRRDHPAAKRNRPVVRFFQVYLPCLVRGVDQHHAMAVGSRVHSPAGAPQRTD